MLGLTPSRAETTRREGKASPGAMVPPGDAQLYVAEDLLVNGHPVEEDQVVKGDHRNHLPFICITRVMRFLTVL